jgi:heme A synthase
METHSRLSAFAKYAWFALAYNVVVIIWGVFLRASHSGDGCGQHWLTCGGEVVPSAPQMKTVIEFSHRITTTLDGFVVIGLLVWAFLLWYRERSKPRSDLLKFALASFIFVSIEGALGAGLVLTGNTADNWTPARPYWAIGHLINTFLLLGSLTLTVWFSGPAKRLGRVPAKYLWLMAIGVIGIFLVGSSGSLAALSNMLFPSTSIIQGVVNDFAGDSPGIVRLRVSHPILSVIVGVFLILLAGWLRSAADGSRVRKWSNVLSVLVLIQFASGAVTLLLHAPILMQLAHLFLADAVWTSFVFLCAEFLAKPDGTETAAETTLN